jgi:hypothetical protein
MLTTNANTMCGWTTGYDFRLIASSFNYILLLLLLLSSLLLIHKYTWTSPDGKTHNQIDHILVDRQRHSNILHVALYMAADCDTDHYLVVAKVREREANKQRSHRFHMESIAGYVSVCVQLYCMFVSTVFH